MKEGFARTSPKSVHLEATTVKNRDIYAHFGFEVEFIQSLFAQVCLSHAQIDEEHLFGKGRVDRQGLAAKGTAATGYPEWVMTKVSQRMFSVVLALMCFSVKWET